MTIPAFPPGQNSASTPCFRSFPASSTYLSDPGPESRISESSAGNPRDFSARTIAFRRISVLPVPAEPWDDAADFPAASFVQMVDRDAHALFFIGTDEIHSGGIARPLAVHEDQRHREPVRPVAGSRPGSAPNRDAAQNWWLSSRSRLLTGRILKPEIAARKFLRQRHQDHVHAALHRVDRMVWGEDDHVSLPG